ncbi:MAG: RraA family protein, partial [Bryobacteraceae bacterium]
MGRVFTTQYMPVRPECVDAIEPDRKSYGKYSQSNQRVIDMLQPGDVLVVDLFGKVESGAFLGDNLARAIRIATGNGFIVNGGVRDLQGLVRIGVPI